MIPVSVSPMLFINYVSYATDVDVNKSVNVNVASKASFTFHNSMIHSIMSDHVARQQIL